ncbi:hypothetical protein [Agrobacterium pusense]|uniref:hypothetical protein n=1 Tax=Agrobacterium pusense TaxID=648995 RepID=UPI002FE3719D
MECNFTVGQKVVMVEAYKPHVYERAADEGVTLPTKGTVYTIRGMEPGEGWHVGMTFIWLEELHNAPSLDGIEPNWDASLFRPLVERKTDISIFKAMLNPSKEQVPA